MLPLLGRPTGQGAGRRQAQQAQLLGRGQAAAPGSQRAQRLAAWAQVDVETDGGDKGVAGAISAGGLQARSRGQAAKAPSEPPGLQVLAHQS